MLDRLHSSSRFQSLARLLIALIAAHAAAMGLAPASHAQTTTGTLVGSVYDNRTGRGVPLAKIVAANGDNGEQRETRTDASGNYTLPLLKAGTYTLTARKDGYVDQVIEQFPVEFNQKNVVTPPHFTLSLAGLSGKVVDRLDNILQGAVITITHQKTGASRASLTDRYGNYSFKDLRTGDYLIAASWRDGAAQDSALRLMTVDRKQVYAPTIKLSRVTSPAPVPASQTPAPVVVADGGKLVSLVRLIDAARSGNITERQIDSLPVGASSPMRSFDEFALLLPGVAPPPYTPGVRGPGVGFGIGTAGQFAVNGMRARSNNFSVDGSDNNDPDVGVRRQGFVALVPQPLESIKEVSISTLLWDAEMGRNFGAQVNAVSKYGSNKFHGQAYAYVTDARLNARNFFDYAGGEDPLTRTQAGLVVGGPIASNRTQFFASLEREVINASTEQHFATPTETERSFSGGERFGVLLPGSGSLFQALDHTTPIGGNVLSFYPLPNNPAGPYGANTFTQVLPADGYGTVLSFKVTHQLPGSHFLNARYNFTDDERTLPSVNRAIFSTIDSQTRSHNFSLILDSELSPVIFNQARFSFGRTRLGFSGHAASPFIFSRQSSATVKACSNSADCPTGGGDESAATVASQTGPIGQLIVEPFSPVGIEVFTFPQSRASNTFQYADTMSWAAGGHTIKFGGNIRRYQLNSLMDRLYRPQLYYGAGLIGQIDIDESNPNELAFSSAGPAEFISGAQLAALGVPSSILQTITSNAPNSTVGLRLTEFHLFFNDNWRVRRNFTFSYGLRYEYNTVPTSVGGVIERAIRLENVPASGNSRFDSEARTEKFLGSLDAYSRVLDGREKIYEPDRNNFGPYISLAWSPGSSARMAVRAGYGIYYDTILGAVVSQSRNVFPNEIPINVDPSFLVFDGFNLNNPAFLRIVRDADGNFTNPVQLLRPGACNQFGTCNQLGGAASDFRALIGQLFSQNLGGGLAFTLTEKNLRTPYAQQWHLSVESEMAGDYLLSAAYVGTKGTKLTRLTTPNLGPNAVPFIPLVRELGTGSLDFPVVFNPLIGSALVERPDSNLGPFQIYENSANSTYHALQLEARKRYSHGFHFTAAYTWSHALDYVSDVFTIAGAPIIAQDSRNLRLEHGDSSFDIRHRFAGSLVWDLPFYSNARGAKRLLSGWQLASIFQAHTGQPFTLNLPFDANLDGNFTDRPDTTDGLIFFSGHGPRRVAIAEERTISDFFRLNVPSVAFPTGDPTGFVNEGLRAAGKVGRNTARGDGFVSLDASLKKTFRFSEARRLEFRTDAFNLLNRANFALPVRVIGAPGFGSAIETVSPARTIQLSLKYVF